MRRTAAASDTHVVNFETVRDRLPAIASPRGRVRAATVIELLPLIPLAVQFSLLTDSDELTPIWPLGMVAGLGWIIMGHWRIGLGFAVARLFLLYAGFAALIYVSVSDPCFGEGPGCVSDGGLRHLEMPLLWVTGAFYVVVTLGSAALVAHTPVAGAEAAEEAG